METINASYFKARCLAILDRVRETGERIVILKRGRPVAELWPPSQAESQYPQSELEGTVTVIGDIVGARGAGGTIGTVCEASGATPDRTGGKTPRNQPRRVGGE